MTLIRWPVEPDEEQEEAYWENLSEDEWEDFADEDEQEEHAGGWVQVGEVVGRIVKRLAIRVNLC